jgi:hypothetical protein
MMNDSGALAITEPSRTQIICRATTQPSNRGAVPKRSFRRRNGDQCQILPSCSFDEHGDVFPHRAVEAKVLSFDRALHRRERQTREARCQALAYLSDGLLFINALHRLLWIS